MIIRPIARTDLDALLQIAEESGPGFTSLVADRDLLAAKIDHAITSFRRPVAAPGNESYLFVLEDARTGAIMGTTGIEARVGLSRPLYHYHCSPAPGPCPDHGRIGSVNALTLCNHYTGCTEICTLFLRPHYRRMHAGKLLSRVRFLFMAQHPERFAPTVIAEMRGVSSAQGQSPFWDWFREHLIDLDFATVTSHVGAGHTALIAERLPRHPLFCRLLSDGARSVIGRVHPRTEPALALLQAEGFRYRGYVDPFDGGPTVEAQLSSIRSVTDSTPCRVVIVEAASGRQRRQTPDAPLLLANTSIRDFRATVSNQAIYRPDENCLLVPASLSLALGLRAGGTARFTELTATASAPSGTANHATSPVHNRWLKEPQYA